MRVAVPGGATCNYDLLPRPTRLATSPAGCAQAAECGVAARRGHHGLQGRPVSAAAGFVSLCVAGVRGRRHRGGGCTCAAAGAGAPVGAQLVWFTGCCDLRAGDHGGLQAAAAADGRVVPIFVLEPRHLVQQPPALRRLRAALLSLERELASGWGARLLVRSGVATDVLPALASECGGAACHMAVEDVEDAARAAQSAAAAALEATGVAVVRWDGSLREGAWSLGGDAKLLPCMFPEYAAAAAKLPVQAPGSSQARQSGDGSQPLASDGVPTMDELLRLSEAATSPAVLRARAECDTSEPFDELVTGWCGEPEVRAALDDFARQGRDAFADRFFGAAVDGAAASLHAASAQWLLDGTAPPSSVFAEREAAVRAFSPALSLGSLSAREVMQAARSSDEGGQPGVGDEWTPWARSTGGTLADVVEWREWFTLLARRTLALQDAGLPAGAAGLDTRGAPGGAPREAGTFGFWRWRGQHLVRYQRWEAGADYDGEAPALLLVHGFAASCEQWERLVCAMRAADSSLPPVFALDLLGFGHSEKPGISYTQHVWEAQVCDFAIEVMGGRPLVVAGNSIGGGIAAGAAANLRGICQGVVLCNTAGLLVRPEEYEVPAVSWREMTLRRTLPKAFAPVPLFGQRGLDLFGDAVISLIYPQIRDRLANIYDARPENADDALAFAIEQGASSPGSNNVIGSGQKLLPQRPLNEVLNGEQGFGGPVLVLQGLDDRVSGPARAIERADIFEDFRAGVDVMRVEQGGHCVQDEAPEVAAARIIEWLPQAVAWKVRQRSLETVGAE